MSISWSFVRSMMLVMLFAFANLFSFWRSDWLLGTMFNPPNLSAGLSIAIKETIKLSLSISAVSARHNFLKNNLGIFKKTKQNWSFLKSKFNLDFKINFLKFHTYVRYGRGTKSCIVF